jgi:hypothetical protein
MQRLDQYGKPDDRAGCYYHRREVLELLEECRGELQVAHHVMNRGITLNRDALKSIEAMIAKLAEVIDD